MANKRPKPEIIPPNGTERGAPRGRIFADTHATERVYIARPTSFGTILVILITGLLLAVLFVLLLGALLIWLPAVILFATAVIVVGLVRAYFQGQP
jgi:hypothetical protein